MKDKEFRTLLDDDWKKIKAISSNSFNEEFPDTVWNYYISEPFPSVWPPQSDLFLIYYAYGEGFCLSSTLQEGVIVSEPWAKIEFDYKNNQVLNTEILTKKIILLGSQCIEAMNGHEIGAFDHAISLENYLLSKEEDRSTKHLKDYYCLWIKHHKTFFEKIMPKHKDFAMWLDKKC